MELRQGRRLIACCLQFGRSLVTTARGLCPGWMSFTGNISDFERFRSSIRSAALGQIADCWQAGLGNKRMPGWGCFEPACISPRIKRIFAFAYDRASGEISRSLAGKEIISEINRNLAGTLIQLLQPPRLAVRMHYTVSRVVRGPFLYRGTGKLFQQGAHIAEGERIILPISADGITGDGALGASDYDHPTIDASTEPVEVLHDIEEWFSA